VETKIEEFSPPLESFKKKELVGNGRNPIEKISWLKVSLCLHANAINELIKHFVNISNLLPTKKNFKSKCKHGYKEIWIWKTWQHNGWCKGWWKRGFNKFLEHLWVGPPYIDREWYQKIQKQRKKYIENKDS